MIDPETYATIQKLIDAGVLKAKEPFRTLYRSQKVEKPKNDEKQRRLAETQKLLDEAERKMKMCRLLSDGGFPIESLEHGKNAFVVGCQCIALLPDSDTLTENFFQTLFQALKEENVTTEKEAYNCVKRLQLYFDAIAESFCKARLV